MLLMRRAGYAFHTTSEFEIVRQIKERFCNVSYRLPKQTANMAYTEESMDPVTYTMPDGSHITLNKEVMQAPEILFNPDLIGLEYPGVHEILYNTIMSCDVDLRKTLFNQIIVAGETTLMQSFCKRLHTAV
jgi:actin-related protein